jgi:hypothetical protein
MIKTDATTIKNWAILNSGATSHFLTTNTPAANIIPATVPIIARLPNGKQVQSTHTCTLDLPALPSGACAVHIIPGLASHSLLLVVTICNVGCNVTFTKIGCTITYCSRTIICGSKCTRMGLWMIPLADGITTLPHSTSNPTPIAIAVHVVAMSSAAEYACYVHQCLCSSPATTLLHALEKSAELKTIPRLAALIYAHLPRSTAMDKGHMQQQRANTVSTRNNQANIIAAHNEVDQMSPTQEACAMHNMFCFAALADATTGTMYTNLTGAFPIQLFKNMQYLFVVYVYDINTIIVRPMPSRLDASFISAFSDVFAILHARDYQPTLTVMDNKCSKAVKNIYAPTKWIYNLSRHTTTMLMWLNAPLPRSKSILLLH